MNYLTTRNHDFPSILNDLCVNVFLIMFCGILSIAFIFWVVEFVVGFFKKKGS
jgi:hypothetical protein